MTINQADYTLAFQTMLPAPLTRPKNSAKLPPDFAPGRYTVLCGRGKVCSASPGNKNLRSLVNAYLTPYSQAKNKIEKSTIVSAIVNAVRKEAPVGAFVKQDKNGSWWEVEDSFAREKIGCIFRDILHTQYRSSTKAKFARKKALESKGGHRSYQKKCLLSTSTHSKSSYDTCTSTDSQSASMNHELTRRQTNRSYRENGSFSLSADQSSSAGPIDSFQLHGYPIDRPETTTSQPLMAAALPCKADYTQYRPHPRFDVLRSMPAADGFRYDNRRSTATLVNDAFEIMGVAELEDDDFPDDISDIFDDDQW
mmetsp:Transcript_91531/g.137052  ORF Transcript_91531/g.137052 Transcript_91531/m.137052 type:complete len:310 (-) Transcript_91531:38-967(-)|eukprot:CAMPEP_0117035026 /NCGR_PEP_ID=MMETSP0472-20121206/24901_1 /TAXON_ID=693140 ORGANISM="Tiarina fusus, Strain LIS" /NCGR_SAMPLE_ID=MMETSP0472 /ASSEMBLY_ACC=CAM_ASM_000603 /LENGTH=309 /DNA_ID=CAMNT_0004744373 /DNA_START=90 /DNA_END=1019 /DNA_ORIENTATION=-